MSLTHCQLLRFEKQQAKLAQTQKYTKYLNCTPSLETDALTAYSQTLKGRPPTQPRKQKPYVSEQLGVPVRKSVPLTVRKELTDKFDMRTDLRHLASTCTGSGQLWVLKELRELNY